MNENICVISETPYKYATLARHVIQYYQLIPANVVLLSTAPSSQYHPNDVIPRTVVYTSCNRKYGAITGLFKWIFAFLEFYSVFYQLLRNNPGIIHYMVSTISAPSLFALQLYAFYKKPKMVIHLKKELTE